MKKLKNKSGFTLIEMLIAVAILVILIVAMQSGLTAGTKAYTASIFESNSAALEGILNTALGDILRYSEAITPNPGFSVEPHAPEGFKDDFGNILLPADVPFVYTNYDYNVRNAYFDIMSLDPDDPVDTLVVKDLQCSSPDELVNTGAYPGLAIANFAIAYDEVGNLYNITYQIVDTESHNAPRDAHCTVRIMNPDSDELPTTETTGPSEPEPTIAWPDHRPDGGGGTTPGGGSSGGGGESGGETVPSCKHNYVEKTEKEATCTETGLKRFTCSLCSKYYTETIKALGHDWSAWEIKETPVGSGKGLKTRHCQRTGCKATEEKEFSASECQHTYTETPGKNVAATCTEAGSKVYTCSKCGHVKTETIPALKHVYKSKVTKAAKCEEEGIMTYTCTREGCKHSYTEPIPALQHEYKSKVTKAAKCEKTGTMTYTCTREGCKHSYTEPIPALQHEYKSKVTKAAKCEAEGTMTYTCTREGCKHSYTEKIPATGHTWPKEATSTDPATCTTPKKLHYKCLNCSKTKNVDDGEPLGHIWGDWNTVKQPTNGKKGTAERICSRAGCKDTLELPKSSYPTWNSKTQYSKHDIVIQGNSVYIAKVNRINVGSFFSPEYEYNKGKNPSTEGEFWKRIPNWSSENDYYLTNTVVYNGKVYEMIAIKVSRNEIPDETSASWEVK